jgi:AcrR family transcriptional regulator
MASKPAAVATQDSVTEADPCAGRPMRADARRNYERLLGAGREVLAERGSEASMDEIAKRADVGVGTLYRHFPRRIDLVEAIYRNEVDGLVERAECLRSTVEPWDALVEWLVSFVEYGQSKRVFFTELHEAFEKNPDLALDSREKIASAAASVLTRAQQAGLARTDIDHSDLMQLVGGMCMARNASLEQNRRLLQLVLDGIRSKP